MSFLFFSLKEDTRQHRTSSSVHSNSLLIDMYKKCVSYLCNK
jgi:hypothetical protein